MCTRTLNSYGCGCRHKLTQECYSQHCTGETKYHFIREGDCKECRRGGNRVTRGIEGKGRYGRELKQSNAPATRLPLSPISPNIKSSPWAPDPPRPREKEWRSPVRRKADDAWLAEHERRERDLEAKSNRGSPRGSVSSPTADHARDHRCHDESPAELLDKVRRLEEEVQRLRIRRWAERSSSQESFGTMDSFCSPPRRQSFDSGFHVLPNPHIPKVSSHHGLGRGLGNIVRDSTRSRNIW
jgi:hypothetical protein